MIDNGILCESLYRLGLSALPFVYATLTVNFANSYKHLRLNKKSSTIWHKCLSHISRQIIERLIKDEILSDLDFLDFDTCADCIKRKPTSKVRNAKIDRCTKLLWVIYTNICGSFTHLAMGDHKYFIMFLDDSSCYGFVKLIREKSDSLEAFKTFNAKVELQQGKKIKMIHSDRGCEYYGRYDEMVRKPRLFAKYLQECGIDAQYIMLGTP